jgi:hypothetical protein
MSMSPSVALLSVPRLALICSAAKHDLSLGRQGQQPRMDYVDVLELDSIHKLTSPSPPRTSCQYMSPFGVRKRRQKRRKPSKSPRSRCSTLISSP